MKVQMVRCPDCRFQSVLPVPTTRDVIQCPKCGTHAAAKAWGARTNEEDS